MNKYAAPEIAKNVFALGSIDWKRRVFDALAPTPLGTTYNCYLVKGGLKTALIDTVHLGYEAELSGKIDQILGSHAIDYVVMNHAEPDHAGSIPHILGQSPAVLLCSAKGAELAKAYYGIPAERIRVVKDGDVIDLGGRTLKFIGAPFLHWPETIFTYLIEDRILFSCDFFGAHNTTGLFDDEAEDVVSWAKKYYGEIMMPLAKMARMGMAKIKDLPVNLIAPSHGPIYRHPETILAEYAKWTNGETRAKVMVIYVSMYGTVERMVGTLVEGLLANGIEVRVLNLASSDIGEIAGQAVDARAVVLASPTVLNALHPLAQFAAMAIKTSKPPFKYGVIMNSYGWGKGAVKQGLEFFEEMGIELVDTVEVKGTPAADDFSRIGDVAGQLAAKILADGR